MKNTPHIIKDYYPVNYSDLIEFIPLKGDKKGRFNFGTGEANHIKHNGRLVTDYNEISKILKG